MLILARSGQESEVKSPDSITESADSTTDSIIIDRLSVSNMFNILNPVGRREIGLVGMGFYISVSCTYNCVRL